MGIKSDCNMIQNSFSEYIRNIPLFLGGLFFIYLGAIDQTIFDSIVYLTNFDKFGITLATALSAGIPIFFAIGLIKKGIFIRWQTLDFYEKILRGKIFSIFVMAFLICFSYLTFTNGIFLLANMLKITACTLLFIYLLFDIKNTKSSP